MNVRDKSIIVGLYLSKYNLRGLAALGFNSFQEAFNIIGFALGCKPSSIKNYRDEFDPLFPNDRKGWHKRPIRDYCKVVYDNFSGADFEDFTDIIKAFYVPNYEIEKFIHTIEKRDFSSSVSKRLATGKAAEEYFKLAYKKIDIFQPFDLIDTTQMACGFDYKLSNGNDFYCVEVKGLHEQKGNIQLTEKEFEIAKKMKGLYCLFMVTNFKEKPTHDFIFDPLNSRLIFKEVRKEITQITYHTVL